MVCLGYINLYDSFHVPMRLGDDDIEYDGVQHLRVTWWSRGKVSDFCDGSPGWEALATGSCDAQRVERLAVELQRQREAEDLEAVEIKHLKGLLTREEALLARQHLLQANRDRRVKYQQEVRGDEEVVFFMSLALLSASPKPNLRDGGRVGERRGVASQPTQASFRANQRRCIPETVDGASYRTSLVEKS
uniref:Uncharacterized protein n=1 Tax=Timema monikensis TaxID=170555 RepID=A0A7R9E9W1_9NEOP|nr:unnamed protein product [Timema monikensis]